MLSKKLVGVLTLLNIPLLSRWLRVKADDYDLNRAEWEHLIDLWIFNELDRMMLKRRLLDGIVFEKLAEEFNLSVQQAKARIYKSQKNIIKHL